MQNGLLQQPIISHDFCIQKLRSLAINFRKKKSCTFKLLVCIRDREVFSTKPFHILEDFFLINLESHS